MEDERREESSHPANEGEMQMHGIDGESWIELGASLTSGLMPGIRG